MHIVCLAWGSLVWKPGPLRLAGAWRADGPMLPIEFARVGDAKELATALCPGAALLPAWWARLEDDDLACARERLREREGIPPDRPEAVGSLVLAEPPTHADDPTTATIERWSAARDAIDAVIWTALPPRYDGTEGRIPSPGEAVRYLAALTGHDRAHAEDYIRRVPPVFDTPIRRAIATRLGWTPR